MSIQFPKLLQDSWNFMRNQPNFTFTALGLLMLVQLIVFYITPQNKFDPATLQAGNFNEVLPNSLLPLLFSLVVSVLMNILIILNIKAINQGHYQHFFQQVGTAVKMLMPIVSLSFLSAIPLSMGVAAGLMASQSGSLAMVSLPLMITGIFFFVKWCLAIYVYIIEEPQKKVFETLSFTWRMSKGKMGTLFLFCIISYLFPSMLSALIGTIGGEIGAILSQLIGVFLSLFVEIFGFRFYQLYRQHEGGR